MLFNILFLIATLAFICELLDSSLGMGYGTILSPLLIMLGFPTLAVIPCVLITQAIGGICASFLHHHYENAQFSFSGLFSKQDIKKNGFIKAYLGMSEDLKLVIMITLLGVLSTIAAAIIGISLPKKIVDIYIGILVTLVGILLILNISFSYSKYKMIILGIISAFNKGISGGGYGPIVTGTQVVFGRGHKKAIACTTAAEPLICIAGFFTYALLNKIPDLSLMIPLGIGAIFGGCLGPVATKHVKTNILKKTIAIIILILGILTLMKTLGIITLKISA